jgi:imidazole glycerol-phosphate synthase subunit HisH
VSAARIGIADYGMGNRRSVEKALERVGARTTISAEPGELRRCDGLVVPGVGAFPQAMRNLRKLGLDELVSERLDAGVPVLGICLGMQLLFESSSELGGAEGLGLMPGEVAPLRAPGLKLPHIGWNRVRLRRPSELTSGLPDACAFYHVHSLAPVPADPDDVLGEGEYGEPFVSMVQPGGGNGRVFFGVQFHPEKSSRNGLRLLENFAAICARVAA